MKDKFTLINKLKNEANGDNPYIFKIISSSEMTIVVGMVTI